MNLKQKIKNVVESGKADDKLSAEIARAKNKFASSMDYETYNKLSDIEHSLYRYNTFVKNDMSNYAEKEGKVLMNLAEDNIVLKGGISNTKYIWRTEPNACKKCQDLDGTTYDCKEDIPEKPHPNCKCHIEEERDDEACDCLDEAQNKFKSMISKVNKLRDDLHKMVAELVAEAMSGMGQSYNNLCQNIIDEATNWDNAIGDFARNYNDMIEADWKYSDKYFHAKANCQAAQRGLLGEVIANAISLLREIEEGTRKVVSKGNTLTEQIKDAKQDMKANKYGRKQGKTYPDDRCEVLIDIFRPNGLPDKY